MGYFQEGYSMNFIEFYRLSYGSHTTLILFKANDETL